MQTLLVTKNIDLGGIFCIRLRTVTGMGLCYCLSLLYVAKKVHGVRSYHNKMEVNDMRDIAMLFLVFEE